MTDVTVALVDIPVTNIPSVIDVPVTPIVSNIPVTPVIPQVTLEVGAGSSGNGPPA